MMPFTRCTQVGPYAVLRDGIPSELESRSLLNPQQPKRCKKSLQAWPCVSCLLPKQLRPLRACKPVQREASELREGGEREGREDAVPIVAILAVSVAGKNYSINCTNTPDHHGLPVSATAGCAC